MVLCWQVRDGPAFEDLGKGMGSVELHPPAAHQGALEPKQNHRVVPPGARRLAFSTLVLVSCGNGTLLEEGVVSWAFPSKVALVS